MSVTTGKQLLRAVKISLLVGVFAAGLALSSTATANAQVNGDAVARCSSYHRFGGQPVDIVKTADLSRVLAQAHWGYNSQAGICYLTLDNQAQDILRANADSLPNPVTAPINSRATERCSQHHRFGNQPVDIVKTADLSRVLAKAVWEYSSQGGFCYLTLDAATTAVLRYSVPGEREREVLISWQGLDGCSQPDCFVTPEQVRPVGLNYELVGSWGKPPYHLECWAERTPSGGMRASQTLVWEGEWPGPRPKGWVGDLPDLLDEHFDPCTPRWNELPHAPWVLDGPRVARVDSVHVVVDGIKSNVLRHPVPRVGEREVLISWQRLDGCSQPDCFVTPERIRPVGLNYELVGSWGKPPYHLECWAERTPSGGMRASQTLVWEGEWPGPRPKGWVGDLPDLLDEHFDPCTPRWNELPHAPWVLDGPRVARVDSVHVVVDGIKSNVLRHPVPQGCLWRC